jgi:hypothetical protein
VFMGVFMKLGDIRMNYLKSISLADTIPTRLVPPCRTLCPRVSGDDLLITAPRSLAVVPRFIEPCGAFAAGFLDDDLFLGLFERFAVVHGFVGASGAGVALPGDGVLGIRKAGECVNRY